MLLPTEPGSPDRLKSTQVLRAYVTTCRDPTSTRACQVTLSGIEDIQSLSTGSSRYDRCKSRYFQLAGSVPNMRSPASPSPGRMYAFSSS